MLKEIFTVLICGICAFIILGYTRRNQHVLYYRAAEQGDVDAQYNLAVCYENGTGVERDEQKAVEWYKKAAEQGDARAQFNLALCYKNGIGVEKDEQKAVEWYKEAAEQGDAIAQFNLAMLIELE